MELANRYNKDKIEWDNFPLFLLDPLMKVAQFGAKKYDKFNFLKGGPQSQYLNSMKRHIRDYEDPRLPDYDLESEVNSLAHTAWNALVAIYMLENHPELDDRFKIENNGKTLRL